MSKQSATPDLLSISNGLIPFFLFSVSLRIPVITILFPNSNCWIEERERGREGRREEKERKGNEFQFLDGRVDEGEGKRKE